MRYYRQAAGTSLRLVVLASSAFRHIFLYMCCVLRVGNSCRSIHISAIEVSSAALLFDNASGIGLFQTPVYGRQGADTLAMLLFVRAALCPLDSHYVFTMSHALEQTLRCCSLHPVQ